MYKVTMVEGETTVRRRIIPTVDWAALDCIIAGGAVSREEGVELVAHLSSNIIVMDIETPRIDGAEMTAELREQGCRVKFIILTVYSDFKYAQSALRLGVSDYLPKPLRDGGLEHTVGHIREQMEEYPPGEEETDAILILRLYSDKRSRNKYVEAATRHIKECYWEDIAVNTVASSLEVDEGYSSRAFKKETDYIFINYLACYRTQMIMNLLKGCRVEVYEVAGQAGYSDTIHFGVQFKKILGVSSSEYQDRCRQLQQSEQVIISRESRGKRSTIHWRTPTLHLLRMSIPAKMKVRIYRPRVSSGFLETKSAM